METQFEVQPFTLESIARGQSSISIKVKGFWSSDSINIYANPRIQGKEWKFEICWGSGGRDPKEVPNDEDAAENFAAAMIQASNIVRNLRLSQLTLQTFFEQHLEEVEAKQKERDLKRKALIEDDEPMSRETIEQLIRGNTHHQGEMKLNVYLRGDTDRMRKYTFKRNGNRLTAYRFNIPTKISFIIDEIATMSSRYEMTK